ncbi:glutamine synthetase family protein [Natronorubrum aibiense]|uniref:Glutamate--ammonia ligase n=1 Tax=Natronorubrum aibiense TaxID=348826 RepID=A0A5P9P8Q2_9EURY|nr:glutamine synthetase family protein [Natronorubrum aibiense]QFU84531.1 glutamine synthetase [Natronorubrum aibiense]
MSDATAEMVSRLERGDIDHIFVEFPDINGISRSKQLTTDYFLERWKNGFTMNLLLLAQTPRNHVPDGTGFGAEIDYGDGVVHPDPKTFHVLPWRDDAARVICDFKYDGEPVLGAPRTVLKRVLEQNDLGFDFYAGSELEFYLLEETGDGYGPATSDNHECVTWATEEISQFYNRLVDLADDFEIDIQSLQHEHGAGQLEVLFDYGRPLEQADTTFEFKRLVKQVGRERDQWPTFMAKPYGDRAGSGYHLHVSAFDGDTNILGNTDGLSNQGRHFIGGLIEHADSLAAFGTPNINAFKRYKPGSFAPYTASWGYDNRMSAIRIPPGVVRAENRIASAEANPYLVIASTIAAGLHGIRQRIEPSEPVVGDPTGNRPKLPQSPELALRALENDDALAEILGSDIIQVYTASKRRELQAFRDHVTQWERDQYVKTL